MNALNPNIYAAGKTWHSDYFCHLRDNLGFNINARWIDLDNNSDFVKNHKDKLWNMCFEDVRDCDIMVIYGASEEEEHRGVLVELGMAYAFDKPVFFVGSSKTFISCEISDVAFMHYHKFINLGNMPPSGGFATACAMWRKGLV